MVCPSWLSFILYNPVRKICTDRAAILNEAGITDNSVVLEVGAGNGFLTEMIAERARKIYAVELQEGMIRKLKKRLAQFKDKVLIIRGDIASIPLDERFADVCILYYSFHEFTDQNKAADAIARAVKSGGTVAIYEPTMEVGKVQMEKTIELFIERGFITEAKRKRFFTQFAKLRKDGE